MTSELKKRIITSVLLLVVVTFCIFNQLIYNILIILISGLIFLEINKLIFKIKKNLSKNNKLLFSFLSILFILILFIPSAINLHYIAPIFVFYVLSVCICSDIGGFGVGKIIGGKKLTKISPNKTISGSIGSFIFSLIPYLLFYSIDKFIFDYTIYNFLLCLQISLVCQLGDLFISYIKRKAKVKDTGNFLPGHGGLLDRIDGIIFVVPFVWIYQHGLSSYFTTFISIIS